MKKTYRIDVECANCAAKMEDAINKLDGISHASVNFLTQKLAVEFTDETDISATKKAILKACRKFEPDVEITF